jgi:lactaldehyde dehydrogenase/glycolaldehyde dehydrogenase
MTTAIPEVSEPLYIGGTWRAASGEPLDVIDPADEQVLAKVPSATAAETHEALAVARQAQPGWARTPSVERGRHLRAMADVLRRHKATLAGLISTEMGKPVRQAADELDFAVGFLSYSAEWDRRLEGEILPGEVPGEVVHLTHAPVGIVVAICPWNFPLAVLCRKLGPALVTGKHRRRQAERGLPAQHDRVLPADRHRTRPAARRAQPGHRRRPDRPGAGRGRHREHGLLYRAP